MNSVELERVRKTYGEFVAVNNISIAIEQGTVFGLLGPNGAGKTSTIRMMIGITAPDAGAIRIFGQPFSRELLTRIGYLPEERGLYRKMTVRDHLSFMAQLHGIASADASRRAADWCRRLDLGAWMNKKVEELSKGMQQKVQFIAALIHDPDLVIMDEPFYGLDPVNAAVLKDVLLEVKRAGRTILFSTHRMDQVEKLCDGICLINRGRAVLQGGLKQVKARYGRNNVQIEYTGSDAFLNQNGLIESFNDYGQYVEVRLRPGADSQALLREVSACARVSRFEVVEPSLEDIFIEVVSGAEEVTANA
jgi:ABC-2 type transport system ATP-binding protein